MSNTPSIKQCNYLLFCIVYQSIFHLYKHFTYWYYSLIFTWILKIVVNVPVILILCFSNCCWNSCCNNDCWNSCYQQRLLEQGKTTKQMFVPTSLLKQLFQQWLLERPFQQRLLEQGSTTKQIFVPTIIVETLRKWLFQQWLLEQLFQQSLLEQLFQQSLS